MSEGNDTTNEKKLKKAVSLKPDSIEANYNLALFYYNNE